VQDEVEKALRRLHWPGKYVLAAGRTDTGVHAFGQVIAFDLDWRHPVEDLRQAINAYLPRDIVAREVRQVPAEFHPRRDALSRQYQYHLFFKDVRDPLRERYAWRVWPPVEIYTLQQAAVTLTGQHDFAGFGTPPRAGGSTVRQVIQARWYPEKDDIVFDVTADAFLYHMVRRMVFLQIEIGQGKLGMEVISQFLNRQEPEASTSYVQGLAPPNGLFLVKVSYPAERLIVR